MKNFISPYFQNFPYSNLKYMSTDQISGIILLFEKLFKKKITKDLEKIEKETQDDFKRKLINIEINSILLSNKQQTYLNKIVVK